MNSPMPSSRPVQRIASVLAVSALALGLAACSKTEEPTVGQRMDSAVEKTEQAAADARVKADNAMQSAEKMPESPLIAGHRRQELTGNQIGIKLGSESN